MIKRYQDPKIREVWDDPNKLACWQRVELAVVRAESKLEIIPADAFPAISSKLLATPIDLAWWLDREAKTHHDLVAFLDERRRHLPQEQQKYFHRRTTSYDTEEPAFALMLQDSSTLVISALTELIAVLGRMAMKYRFTIMLGRTHGQWAELQTFGKSCLCWLQDLRTDEKVLNKATSELRYSKISGAIGSYGGKGGIDPAVEREALKILGLLPYYGATQIMPREIYAPLAEALCQIVLTLHKIAQTIRLEARSGLPLCHEPFGKQQTGSSAMPWKKNPILTEGVEGFARMAQGFLGMIMANIPTWENRAIEQSSCERVAWPDLFHVVVYALARMNKVLSGLVVYPGNMLREILAACETYAGGSAKDFLATRGASFGVSAAGAYGIIQLASFNAFEPDLQEDLLCAEPPRSFGAAAVALQSLREKDPPSPRSIRHIIMEAGLRVSLQLDASEETVSRWNAALRGIFAEPQNVTDWANVFDVTPLLDGEKILYEQILGA